MHRGANTTTDKVRGGGALDVHIYQDGPITITQTLFPASIVSRVNLGMQLGFGFALGVGLAISVVAGIVHIVTSI